MIKKLAAQRSDGRAAAGSADDFAALLRDIATHLAPSGDPDFFPSLVRYLTSTLGMGMAFVGEMLPGAPRRLRTLALSMDGDLVPNREYLLPGTPCDRVIGGGLCTFAQDMQQLFPDARDLAQFAVESYCGTPLFGPQGECRGLLVVMDRKPIQRTAPVEGLLRLLAVHAAAELQRRESETELRRLNRLLRTVTEINQLIVRTPNESQLLTDACRILVEHGGLRMAWVGFADPESNRVTPVAQAGAVGAYLAQSKVRYDDSPEGRGPTGEAIRSGRPVINDDTETNERFAPWRESARSLGYRSSAAFPLRRRGRVVGAINVYAPEPHAFAADEARVLEELAADLGYALQSIEDAAERQRIEDALRESERRLSTLLSNLPGMAYRCANDARWTLEFVSDGCLALTGYSTADFIDKRAVDWAALIHPGDRELVWNGVQAGLAAERAFQLLYRIETAGGEQKWVWEQGRGVYDASGALVALEGFIADMSDRRRTEEALRASEERFKSLTELSSDWYWEQDEHLRFTVITRNKDASERFPIEQSLGKARWELPYIDVSEEEWARHRATLAARQPFRDLVLKRRDASGELRHSSISGVPVFDADGRFRGYRGTGQDITDRVRAEQAVRASEAWLRRVLETLPLGVWLMDASGRIVYGNPTARAIWAGAHYVGIEQFGEYQGWWHDSGRGIEPHEWAAARAIEKGETSLNEVVDIACFDGTRRTILNSAVPLRGETGEIQGAIILNEDISEQMRANAEMSKLTSAVQQTADSVMITDREGVIEYVNSAFEQTTGYTRDEALGRKPSLVKSGMLSRDFYERLWREILAGNVFRDIFINRRKSGELYYEEKTVTPLKDAQGRISHFISTGKDITERMQAQERLEYLAHHDALTGLPNRLLFLDRLTQALIRAHWHQRVVGVMFLDLDRFKNINDTLGHDVGDAFLQAMATRLQSCVREGDTIARLGGDEFAVLVEDIAHAEDVSVIAAKILAAFGRPFVIQGHELFITASIGISLYPSDGTAPAALLKNADAAMYRAKDLGKNNYQFYSADMSALAFERLTLETSLRHALERREFLLHFQPQIELATGRVVGVEALVRWQHPEFGLLAPAQFISVAEETGMIVPIGEWVAQAAMTQVQAWRDAGMGALRLAVNVSGRQFNEPDFIDTIKRLLTETGFDTEALELEITESVIMRNAEMTIERLRALAAMGVGFAIDDFGTGYSSLSYLRRFPIHTLKIDKTFTRDITDDSGDAEIVKTIIGMARGLKLNVIAEGVETNEQLVFLRAHGCHGVQGYLYSRPLPAERMEELLRRGERFDAPR